MRFLLILAITTSIDGSPSVSVIEFETMHACLQEQSALGSWLKMKKLGAGHLHMECLEKAHDVKQ